MPTQHAIPAQVLEAADPRFPEGRLMFSLITACVSAWLDPSAQERVASLLRASSPDWFLFHEEAEVHGVLPVVYAALAWNRELISAAARSQLSRAHDEQVRRSLRLTGELTRILQMLETAGVMAAPFKGPTLAAAAYGDIALRQYSDLDIMIRPSDWPRACEALVRAGYVPEYSVCGRRQQALLATGYECAFRHEQMRTVVEIQWALLPRFYAVHARTDDLLVRSRFNDVQGYRLRALDPHDLLLAASVHAAKHLWRRLCWLLDVVQIFRTQSLDWTVARARARQWGVERMVLAGFALAHRLLDVELPSPAGKWLRSDPAASLLAEEIAQHIVHNRHLDPESLAYFRLISKLREQPSARARFWWRLAATPSFGEWSLVQLPELLFPLYRGVRMARLARRAFTGKDGLRNGSLPGRASIRRATPSL
jgi:hypothetical protein